MSAKYLHIVSFNIPYPADYGGVIDIYYKIKALKNAGVHIILHCYAYGRQSSKELEDLCFEVHYYNRKSGLKYFLTSDPYIVATRNANTMPKNILGDSFPVLFEGLHSTALLESCNSANKRTLVRAHNIEHNYYHSLSRTERNLFRKLFLQTEARKLKRYEGKLKSAHRILAIAKHETSYFEKRYGNALFIPAFHRFQTVSSLEGFGTYIMYHGNLSVPENSEMFLKLVGNTLSKIATPIIVAGKNPSKRFLRKLAPHSHIRVIPNPTEAVLDKLIQEAHVNLLFTAQPTGIKLKLLHALFAGRHCLVNLPMVEGTGLSKLCTVSDEGSALKLSLDMLMGTPFKGEQIDLRKKALKDFSNRANAEKIVRLLA
jgi:hypothetical protein